MAVGELERVEARARVLGEALEVDPEEVYVEVPERVDGEVSDALVVEEQAGAEGPEPGAEEDGKGLLGTSKQ